MVYFLLKESYQKGWPEDTPLNFEPLRKLARREAKYLMVKKISKYLTLSYSVSFRRLVESQHPPKY